MKLWIIAVGNKMPAWVDMSFCEYAKRMPPETKIQLVEIKAEKRSAGKSLNQVLDAERGRILASLPRHCRQVVLDEGGRALSTAQLAQNLAAWMQAGRDVAFVIGGADGLHEYIKNNADNRLSISAMTLPHALVRVVLAEQLYRAVSLMNNHPYHRR
ncbi:MAG TPA: 23S rRNA (pseudouridine(1915)-N(3))-methyltransferase RlmH [Burkholderiales bacterium]|nr:23S rRNA (pseudouridine(1915)-N(3))-methyltransferase RlmH [Burkholderiales bacterium]